MSWQYLLVGYLVLSTVVGLLQRRLGQTIPQYNRIINAFFFLCVHYPIALITAWVVGFHINIGWFNAVTLIGVSVLFPMTDILAFRVSKDVDAGLFGIMQNLNPVITIILAVLLLSERLTSQQFAGTLIIILSALVVSVVSYNRGSKSTKTGIMLAFLTVALLGVGTVYEAWMLRRIGYGAYLIYGTGIQALWMALIAWPQRRHIGKIINRKYGPSVLTL